MTSETGSNTRDAAGIVTSASVGAMLAAVGTAFGIAVAAVIVAFLSLAGSVAIFAIVMAAVGGLAPVLATPVFVRTFLRELSSPGRTPPRVRGTWPTAARRAYLRGLLAGFPCYLVGIGLIVSGVVTQVQSEMQPEAEAGTYAGWLAAAGAAFLLAGPFLTGWSTRRHLIAGLPVVRERADSAR